MTKQDDSKKWIAYNVMSEEAKKILPATQSVQQRVVTAVKQCIDKFLQAPQDMELIFGPGFSIEEKLEIKAYVSSKKLKYMPRFHEKTDYFCVEKNVSLIDVAAYLKAHKGEVYCRYSLVENAAYKPKKPV